MDINLKELNDIKYIDYDMSYKLLSECSKLLVSDSELDKINARKIAIHVLNNWQKLDENTYPIWKDIIESLGFYPYINKTMGLKSEFDFGSELRQECHSSKFLQGTYFHKDQKSLSSLLSSPKSVVASAPTSFGKSLLIEEIVASNKYKNIVIIQPTLALLDETRTKLLKYNNNYKIIVRTSQEPSIDKGNLYLLTAERVMEYEKFKEIDFFIIDEFYKLSLRRKDDRADTLNNAFLKVINTFKCRFYMLGTNIDNITEGFAEKYNAIFYKSNFSLVDCDVYDYYNKIDWSRNRRTVENQKKELLFELLLDLNQEQTLIYCSTPNRARRLAFEFVDFLKRKQINADSDIPLIEWIQKNISNKWTYTSCLRNGISVHDGSLQKHIASSTIEYFNLGLLKYIFCTSTIIEGVNTSAKNVILFDNHKGDKEIDFF